MLWKALKKHKCCVVNFQLAGVWFDNVFDDIYLPFIKQDFCISTIECIDLSDMIKYFVGSVDIQIHAVIASVISLFAHI